MTALPPTNDALVLRTDFTDDEAWRDVCDRIGQPEPEYGFVANVECVSDPRFDRLTPAALVDLARRDSQFRTYLFAVDAVTISDPEHPVLVVDVHDNPGRTFRVTPAELWGIENNLSISNMDFFEFADAVDDDGVFRGFPAPDTIRRRTARRPRFAWRRRPLVWLVVSLVLVAGSISVMAEGGASNIAFGACGVLFFGFSAGLAAMSRRNRGSR